jgi:sodium/potassium-transporting ATPase subunit alpha
MYVTEAAVGSFSMSSDTARDEIIRQRDANDGANALEQLRAIAGLCNAGEFDAATASLPLSCRKIIGDATDQAILRFSEHLGSVSDLKALWIKTFELAFNSKNKFMIRTVSLADKKGLNLALSSAEAGQFQQDDMLLTIKGAPDVLISRCTTFVDRDGSCKALDDQMRTTISLIKDKWSSQGKRVILLARKVVAKADIHSTLKDARFENDVMTYASTGLTFVGILGIVDPPRDDIPTVVRILRGAHIRIFMVNPESPTKE